MKKGGHNVVVVDWFAWFTSHVEESEREKKSKKMLACPLTTPMLLLHVFCFAVLIRYASSDYATTTLPQTTSPYNSYM